MFLVRNVCRVGNAHGAITSVCLVCNVITVQQRVNCMHEIKAPRIDSCLGYTCMSSQSRPIEVVSVYVYISLSCRLIQNFMEEDQWGRPLWKCGILRFGGKNSETVQDTRYINSER